MSVNIAITGLGIVSAIGNDRLSVLESIKANKTGIGAMHYLNSAHSELPVGEVKLTNDEMKEAMGVENDQYISRTSLMGMMAIRQAIAESHIERSREYKQLRVVLISGTTVGGMDITEKYFKDILSSDENLECLKNHDCGSSTETMADYFGIFDECTTISTACSSAANAIILGANLIKDGQADIVVAGGTEALSLFHLNGFNSLMILDREICRPFDASRAGLNLGEGAGYVVLESEELAKERGAEVQSYLTGYGNACDAFHQTASSEDGEGAYLAMTEALKSANLKPNDIQYVNAHGTGTQNNDLSESVAIKRVYGQTMPLVSSTKSFTGHTTSASGGIEAVISILAIQNKLVPSNLGWKNQIEGGITPTLGASNYDLCNVMCNSFGFGGNDSSMIFSLKPTCSSAEDEAKCDCDIKELCRVEINEVEQLAEIKDYIKPLEARRMGKLMKASLLSSLKALEKAGISKPDAIITGTSLGCLENSEKILLQMCEEGEDAMKPTLFMQSTHNTLSSSIAIHTKCHGYNVTYTQKDKSLEWALRDARMLLRKGQVKTVLVGCHDEMTQNYGALMERLGQKEDKQINSVAIVLSCGN